MQCRMTTQAGSQCTREAVEGGLGFCWQHVPVDNDKNREKWKTRLEGAALIVSASELVIKIAELALKHLPELFGSGDPDQQTAKRRLERALKCRPSLDEGEVDYYVVGSRVDWSALAEFAIEAAWLKENAASKTLDPRAVPWLEKKFDAWYQNLNDDHKSILTERLAELADQGKSVGA